MKTQTLEYSDGPTTLQGFLAFDDTTRVSRPGIVLMPEVWGLGDNARARAQQLAERGYAVLAGDPYGGGVLVDSIPEAKKVGQGLRDDPNRVRARTRAALDALAELAIVDRGRLAAIGYCMGGTFALELARSGAPLRGVVAFHAGLETKAPAHRGQIKGSVLVCTGADDTHIPMQQVSAFVEEMRAAEVDYEVQVYGGAQHGFTVREADRRGIPGLAYNAKADSRSWEAMLRFFSEIFVAM